MPIHDWTRVSHGTWHAFHLSWVVEFRNALNTGGLPQDYYAQIEQLTDLAESEDIEPTAVVDETTPSLQTPIDFAAEMNAYVLKRRTVVIRHNSGDRIVALLEIVSPGNKSAQHAINSFVEKAQESLFRGYHLLIVDLFPPGPRDPHGLHALIWRGFNTAAFELAPDEPLALVAYSAGQRKKAYIEPVAVGRAMIEMPLFLTPEMYVNVPLEETYMAAYRGVPRKWRAVLEASGA